MNDINISNGYYVDLSFSDGILFVKFPCNLLVQPCLPPVNMSYKVEPNKIYKKTSDGQNSEYVSVDYASRLIIATDIVVECSNRQINTNLIYSKDIKSFIPEEIVKHYLPKPEEVHLEKKLENNMLNIMESNLEDYELSDIEAGCFLLSNILKIGGI